MKYTAYDGRKFENLDCCERYNSELKEKYSMPMDYVDPIYLLSEKEYQQYKKNILLIPVGWWLRSYGSRSNYAANVFGDGCSSILGVRVNDCSYGVRPALNLEHLKSKIYTAHYKLVNDTFPYRFTWAGVTWRTLEKDKVAIAEMPIFYSKFDDNSNDYESSFIRKKLLQWYNFRVSNHFIVQEVIGD